MAYIRKTKDVWHVLVNYGQGWEHELTEASYREACEQRRTYRENCPQYLVKIKRKRERVPMWKTPKAVSIARYRSDANAQKSRGLKVGGTMTIFAVSDGVTELYIDAYGATPNERKANAITAFEAIRDNEPRGNMTGKITTTYRNC